MTSPVSSSLASVSRNRFIQVVRAAVDRLVRALGVECPPLHVHVGETWCESRGTQLGARSTGDQLPKRVLGRMQNHIGDDLWRIYRRHGLGLHAQVGAGLLEEWRIDARGLDERDGDGNALFLELHPERIRERFEGVLRGTITALQRNGSVR